MTAWVDGLSSMIAATATVLLSFSPMVGADTAQRLTSTVRSSAVHSKQLLTVTRFVPVQEDYNMRERIRVWYELQTKLVRSR